MVTRCDGVGASGVGGWLLQLSTFDNARNGPEVRPYRSSGSWVSFLCDSSAGPAFIGCKMPILCPVQKAHMSEVLVRQRHARLGSDGTNKAVETLPVNARQPAGDREMPQVVARVAEGVWRNRRSLLGVPGRLSRSCLLRLCLLPIAQKVGRQE